MWGIGKIVRRLSGIEQAIEGMQLDLGEVASLIQTAAHHLDRIAVAQEAQVWYTAGRPVGIRGVTINNTVVGSMTVSNVTVELLPAKPTSASQVVTVAVAGFVEAEIVIPVPETLVKFAVPPMSTIDMTVASRDAAGNTSAPFVVAPFEAVDTVAPDSPDGIGAVSVNDTDVPDPGFIELVPV